MVEDEEFFKPVRDTSHKIIGTQRVTLRKRDRMEHPSTGWARLPTHPIGCVCPAQQYLVEGSSMTNLRFYHRYCFMTE